MMTQVTEMASAGQQRWDAYSKITSAVSLAILKITQDHALQAWLCPRTAKFCSCKCIDIAWLAHIASPLCYSILVPSCKHTQSC